MLVLRWFSTGDPHFGTVRPKWKKGWGTDSTTLGYGGVHPPYVVRGEYIYVTEGLDCFCRHARGIGFQDARSAAIFMRCVMTHVILR